MNLKSLSALIALEWKQTLLILVAPILFSLVGFIYAMREDVLFRLSSFQPMALSAQWLAVGCWFCFPEGFQWSKQWSSPGVSLEFYFSQPLSRRTFFQKRAAFYLISFMIPLATFFFYSTTKPMIKVELPYPPEIREITREFYLTHFKGTYLQKDSKDEKGNKTWVVFPQGRVTRALGEFAVGTVLTLLAQCILFTFWRKIWVFPLIVGMGVLLPFLFLFSSGPLSPYEWMLAYTSQYPIIVFLALGAFVFVSQWYCYRRFVNMQVAE